MTDEELIEIARRYARSFAQDDKERDQVATLVTGRMKTSQFWAIQNQPL